MLSIGFRFLTKKHISGFRPLPSNTVVASFSANDFVGFASYPVRQPNNILGQTVLFGNIYSNKDYYFSASGFSFFLLSRQISQTH
jgi:hypothetical protein